jgi:pyruvate dehydrogenase E1 component alpha subunit
VKMVQVKSYDTNFLLSVYEQMLMLRRFEEKAGQLYGMGKIGGFCHLYIGQEAVAIGVQMALNKDDAVITSYRDHGPMLATGSDPKAVMAELLGRASGCSKGKGGSMHMFDLERNFYGGHGIVGAQVPIGTGIAFAYKYRNEPRVCVTYFGDGAANQGQVYEAFNMAKLWNLPVIYIIENNRYAMGTSVARSSSQTDFSKRGESFGIIGHKVDGMDFFAVYETIKSVIDDVRGGKGPVLLEVETYRYRGHSMSDPAKYRSKDEVNDFKENRDPIVTLRQYILQKSVCSEQDLEYIEAKIQKQVKEVVGFAEASPEPDVSELFEDVYV